MESGLRFIVVPPSRPEESLSVAAQRGLSEPQKELSSRFFYDTAGSRLFERITRLPEYYLTRCETEILEGHAPEIVETAGEDLQVVEFGSGSSEKTRLLLKAAVGLQGEVEYVPIDISSEFLLASAEELLSEIDRLKVTALGADYFDALEVLPFHEGTRLFLFLGSTIGNFEQAEAVQFLASVRQRMRPHDRMLVGLDRRKPREIIEPAYNDAEGVTELFNKNILVRINRELCGHFDLSHFQHRAPWVEEKSRIEMRLVSDRDQEVTIEALDKSFAFRQGEYIHTENSHKWSQEVFEGMCAEADMSIAQVWVDSKSWFSVNLLQAK